MSSGDSSDDEDYDAFADSHQPLEKPYPIHDCCEYEEVDALRVSLVVKQSPIFRRLLRALNTPVYFYSLL